MLDDVQHDDPVERLVAERQRGRVGEGGPHVERSGAIHQLDGLTR
jgi:hypothetical protein